MCFLLKMKGAAGLMIQVHMLCSSSCVIVLADFLCTLTVIVFTSCFGILSSSYLFHTYKVINHQPYDQKADVFSFAIVLWELVTAKVFPEIEEC